MPGPSARQAISASLWTPFATLRLPGEISRRGDGKIASVGSGAK